MRCTGNDMAKYKAAIEDRVSTISPVHKTGLNLMSNSVARQLIALIDGFWLEYCLHSEGFSLSCCEKPIATNFLQTHGVTIKTASQHLTWRPDLARRPATFGAALASSWAILLGFGIS